MINIFFVACLGNLKQDFKYAYCNVWSKLYHKNLKILIVLENNMLLNQHHFFMALFGTTFIFHFMFKKHFLAVLFNYFLFCF